MWVKVGVRPRSDGQTARAQQTCEQTTGNQRAERIRKAGPEGEEERGGEENQVYGTTAICFAERCREDGPASETQHVDAQWEDRSCVAHAEMLADFGNA